MAANPQPGKIAKLFTLAADMADGMHDNEVPIGIKQNGEDAIRADLTAAEQAESAYQAGRSGKSPLQTAITIADSNAKAFIGAASEVLAKFLGNHWNQLWIATGFPNNSTGVPRTVAEREALLSSLKTYFTNNPTHEVAVAPFNVTATRADTLHTALSGARANFAAVGKVSVGQLKTARDGAVATLRNRVGGAIEEIGRKLSDADYRWYAFGLNRPADPETAAVPDSLSGHGGAVGSQTAYLDWADARRADHYRVWLLVVGVDDDFKAVESVEDSDATLTDLPAGKTIKVRVTSVNKAGESQPSETVEIAVP